MLTINKEANGSELVISLDGRLDTSTASQLEAELKTSINNVELLVFDMEKLAYVSSAGLRVLLKAQKVMDKQGDMIVRNANQEVKDIFEVTGFDDILNIE